MTRTGIFAAAAFLFVAAAGPTAAAEAIGSVSRMQGESSAIVDGANTPLDLGASVFLNQEVSTGEAARLELTFADGTMLTLGEKAKMILDTFVYNPAEGTGKMKLAVVGAFRSSPVK
jgi:hypothetical protein